MYRSYDGRFREQDNKTSESFGVREPLRKDSTERSEKETSSALVPIVSQERQNHTGLISYIEDFFKSMPFEEILLIGILLILLEDKERDWTLIIAIGYLYISGRDEFKDLFKNVASLLSRLG